MSSEQVREADAHGAVAQWGKVEGSPDERYFLAGPRRRDVELFEAGKIFLEILRGFRKLHFVGPCVTVFGSARFHEGH